VRATTTRQAHKHTTSAVLRQPRVVSSAAVLTSETLVRNLMVSSEQAETGQADTHTSTLTHAHTHTPRHVTEERSAGRTCVLGSQGLLGPEYETRTNRLFVTSLRLWGRGGACGQQRPTPPPGVAVCCAMQSGGGQADTPSTACSTHNSTRHSKQPRARVSTNKGRAFWLGCSC
jgi:hypothetical protein